MRSMLQIKNGDVQLNAGHFEPEVVAMLHAAQDTAPVTTDGRIVITSANDGTHKDGSFHYADKAFDLRVWNIVKPWEVEGPAWAGRIQGRLEAKYGKGRYDVLYEEHNHTIRSGPRKGERVLVGHLHLELDPKSILSEEA